MVAHILVQIYGASASSLGFSVRGLCCFQMPERRCAALGKIAWPLHAWRAPELHGDEGGGFLLKWEFQKSGALI